MGAAHAVVEADDALLPYGALREAIVARHPAGTEKIARHWWGEAPSWVIGPGLLAAADGRVLQSD